jgi:hypothetical protein
MEKLSPKIEAILKKEGRGPYQLMKQVVRLEHQKHAGKGYTRRGQINLLEQEAVGLLDPDTLGVMKADLSAEFTS